MHTSFLLLGSNLGERQANLREAIRQLSLQGEVMKKSMVYRSAAWGNTKQPDFLNMTLEFHTMLSPSALLSTILDIERNIGRKRTEKWGPRSIDIDILFYNDLVINTSDLVIPHPEIQNRRFTLVPLAEIAPGLKHPVLKSTVAELLVRCADTLEVELDGELDSAH